jgi:hypothetical protein
VVADLGLGGVAFCGSELPLARLATAWGEGLAGVINVALLSTAGVGPVEIELVLANGVAFAVALAVTVAFAVAFAMVDGVGSGRCRLLGAVHAENSPAQKASTIKNNTEGTRKRFMVYILLEAFLAGMILVVIVWWTMFSNRPGGEIQDAANDERKDAASQDGPKGS